MNEENTKATIPYYVHEGELERMERINRRMIIIIALETAALIFSYIELFVTI